MKIGKVCTFIFLAVCVVVLVSASTISTSRAVAYKRQVDFPVKSFVPGLTIVGVKIRHDFVLLSLKNDYDKTITAFSVSSSGVIARNEMLNSEYIIAPGSINSGEYELPTLSSREEGIRVLAAVFEDGTTDGVPRFINQILEARAGKQAQMARILPILEDISLTLRKVNSKQERQSIQLRISQLLDCDGGRSFEFCAAFRDEKELALRKLRQFEQIQKDRGEEVAEALISHMKEQYERNNIVLQRSLKQVQ